MADNELTDEYRTEFNAGCQGRLDGLPLKACPHPRSSPPARAWRAGWKDVHQWYAFWAHPDDPRVRALPPVTNSA